VSGSWRRRRRRRRRRRKRRGRMVQGHEDEREKRE